MLKNEFITIKVNPANLKNLVQYIPNIKSGQIITIPITYLTITSHIKIDVVCDICQSERLIPYRQYIKSVSNGGYYSCSQKCSKQKAINSNIEKYGVDNPSKSQLVKDKIKNTFQDRYGVDNISFLPEIVTKIKEGVNNTYSSNLNEIKEKQKNTNIERYGVSDVNKEEWFKDKIRNSNIEKYGVDNLNRLDSMKSLIRLRNIERYGVDHPYKTEKVKLKTSKTNIERYGVENVFQSELIKIKIKETNIKKYGCEHHSQNPEIYNSQILSGFRIKKHDCGLTYQGTYEKDFIDFCISHNIHITKPPSFIYEMEGKSKRYYPDFYCENLNLIIEVKSSYYYNLHIEKNKLKRETITNNGFEYMLILDKKYEEFIKIL